MRILWIQASPREDSQSTKLAEALIDKILSRHDNAFVTHENISKRPPSHLDELQLRSFFAREDQQTEAQQEALEESNRYVHQLQTHDSIVISFPVWNFSVPSSLKAWVDQVVRVGKTFKYVESRPLGLLQNKKVFLVSARGGIYPESNVNSFPFDSSVLLMKTVLAYIGLNDLVELRIDGLAIPGIKETAFDEALNNLEKLEL